MARDTSRPASLIHPPLVGAAATLLIAAFATDVAYWRTELVQWNNFSGWLIAAGLLLAGLAGLALIVDSARHRMPAVAWGRFAAFAVAGLLALLNAFVHGRDAYTAVYPEGVTLSGIVTLILLGLALRGWGVDAPPRVPVSQTGETYA